MKISEDTYILNIYWDDTDTIPHSIGVLAQDVEDYYIAFNENIVVKSEDGSEYKLVPGFNPKEIYKSNQIFDFIKRRLSDKKSKTPLMELRETQGRSMVDSVYLSDDIPSRVKALKISALERAYEQQERLKEIRRPKGELAVK